SVPRAPALAELLGRPEARLRDGARQVGAARPADVLDDAVDRDPRRAQRLEDARGDARAVAHADHGDLRDVRLLRDAAHALAIFHRDVGDDHRADAIAEARSDVYG